MCQLCLCCVLFSLDLRSLGRILNVYHIAHLSGIVKYILLPRQNLPSVHLSIGRSLRWTSLPLQDSSHLLSGSVFANVCVGKSDKYSCLSSPLSFRGRESYLEWGLEILNVKLLYDNVTCS